MTRNEKIARPPREFRADLICATPAEPPAASVGRTCRAAGVPRTTRSKFARLGLAAIPPRPTQRKNPPLSFVIPPFLPARRAVAQRRRVKPRQTQSNLVKKWTPSRPWIGNIYAQQKNRGVLGLTPMTRRPSRAAPPARLGLAGTM